MLDTNLNTEVEIAHKESDVVYFGKLKLYCVDQGYADSTGSIDDLPKSHYLAHSYRPIDVLPGLQGLAG